jgi:hypothetical protein
MTQFLSIHILLTAKKIFSQYRKTAHKNQICSEQEFAQKLLTAEICAQTWLAA